MPLDPTGQEFFPEYNVGVFARKSIDQIYSGPKKRVKYFAKKENSIIYYSKMLRGATCHEFWLENSIGAFVWKLEDSIHETNGKIFCKWKKKKKKTWLKFYRKCP